MPIIYGIAVKREKGAAMEMLQEAEVSTELGVVGDYSGQGGRRHTRQVTLLSFESWSEVCDDFWATPRTMPWSLRRANICVQGLVFTKHHVGKHIRLGEKVLLQVTGETTPCELMNKIHPGLREVLAPDFRAGVTCRVLQGGHIRLQETVSQPFLQASMSA